MHPYPAQPIRVIHCAGNDRAIGKSHAEQLGDAVRLGMPSFYADFWRRLVKNPPTPEWQKPFARVALLGIDPFLVSRLLKHVPAGPRERVKGVAEVSGLSLRELETALVLPDLLPLLQAYLTKLRPAGFVDPHPFPAMACSSFIARGDRFLHGRNLDFPGMAYWDRYAVVQGTRPDKGIPYVAFATAGVPLGGVTGINAEQVSVSLHQHYSRRVSLNGRLPFVIAEEILQESKTLEEALEKVRGARTTTAWAFVITDGKTRRGAIVECDAETQVVRPLGDEALTHSNFFQTAGCRSGEYSTSCRMNWDNQYRARRLKELLSEAGPGLTPEKAASFLGDNWDSFWNEEKVLNRIVSQTYNIQSLVLDSETMMAWVAEGDSPIHLGEYVEFDLGAVLAGREGKTGKRLPGHRYADPKKRDAKQKFILSFIEGFGGKDDEARRLLVEALENDFFPEGAQIQGLMLWKIGEFAEAKRWFERARGWIEQKRPEKFPPEYFEASLYLARTLDLLGNHSEAKTLYRSIAEHPDLEDRNIRRLAGAKGPFQRARVRRVVMPYSSYIPFE